MVVLMLEKDGRILANKQMLSGHELTGYVNQEELLKAVFERMVYETLNAAR